MKASEKNRDPERARKRAMTDARCAWRKMDPNQRAEFLVWAGVESAPEPRAVTIPRGCTCGQDWPCRESLRTDINPIVRASHCVRKELRS